ncbi:MAG: hypothetical protein M1825_003699 [Sarcosagium campestre]|nr:MAG: hypothetical protein M1825_003699 [Sarcosagium campestre]
MQLQLSTLVLCTLSLEGVLAMPSVHHHHHHARSIDKRDVAEGIKKVDFQDKGLYNGLDWDKVLDKTPPAAETPAEAGASDEPDAPSPAGASPDAPPASDTSGAKPLAGSPHRAPRPKGPKKSDGEFCADGFGERTQSVANGNVDQYKGNVGIPYGSNIVLVKDDKNYKYTADFTNKRGEPITIAVWNKAGPDGRPNSGAYLAPALRVPLADGETKTVAFDKNSQVAWAEEGVKTAWGAHGNTWGEADFANESNNEWSGYDVSSIQSVSGNTYHMTITCDDGATSSNKGNGYTSDTQPGGIGGNLAPGPVHLRVTFGA